MLEHISRNLQALAEDLENRITVQNVAEWHSGRVLDWENEAHQFARTVAYGDLSADNPAPITAAYEQRADRAIEIQLEKARVRLAWLLNKVLGHAIKPSAK